MVASATALYAALVLMTMDGAPVLLQAPMHSKALVTLKTQRVKIAMHKGKGCNAYVQQVAMLFLVESKVWESTVLAMHARALPQSGLVNHS